MPHTRSLSNLGSSPLTGTCKFTRYTATPNVTIEAWYDSKRTSGCSVRDLCCTTDSGISTCEFGSTEAGCVQYAAANHIRWSGSS